MPDKFCMPPLLYHPHVLCRTALMLTCTTRFFMSSSIIRASASVLCGDELRELAAAAEVQLPPPLMD